MSKFITFSDGGARGNPGPAGIGGTIARETGEIVAEISQFLGSTTNNQAEYRALIAVLEKALSLGGQELVCYLDSELVVKQLNHEYKVKNKDLAPLFLTVHNLAIKFKSIQFIHIPREKNQAADKLANQAMDRGQ